MNRNILFENKNENRELEAKRFQSGQHIRRSWIFSHFCRKYIAKLSSRLLSKLCCSAERTYFHRFNFQSVGSENSVLVHFLSLPPDIIDWPKTNGWSYQREIVRLASVPSSSLLRSRGMITIGGNCSAAAWNQIHGRIKRMKLLSRKLTHTHMVKWCNPCRFDAAYCIRYDTIR